MSCVTQGSVSMSSVLVNKLEVWLDHPRPAVTILRFHPYSNKLADSISTEDFAILVALCQILGLGVRVYPPVSSDYDAGTWKVELSRTKVSRKREHPARE